MKGFRKHLKKNDNNVLKTKKIDKERLNENFLNNKIYNKFYKKITKTNFLPYFNDKEIFLFHADNLEILGFNEIIRQIKRKKNSVSFLQTKFWNHKVKSYLCPIYDLNRLYVEKDKTFLKTSALWPKFNKQIAIQEKICENIMFKIKKECLIHQRQINLFFLISILSLSSRKHSCEIFYNFQKKVQNQNKQFCIIYEYLYQFFFFIINSSLEVKYRLKKSNKNFYQNKKVNRNEKLNYRFQKQISMFFGIDKKKINILKKNFDLVINGLIQNFINFQIVEYIDLWQTQTFIKVSLKLKNKKKEFKKNVYNENNSSFYLNESLKTKVSIKKFVINVLKKDKMFNSSRHNFTFFFILTNYKPQTAIILGTIFRKNQERLYTTKILSNLWTKIKIRKLLFKEFFNNLANKNIKRIKVFFSLLKEKKAIIHWYHKLRKDVQKKMIQMMEISLKNIILKELYSKKKKSLLFEKNKFERTIGQFNNGRNFMIKDVHLWLIKKGFVGDKLKVLVNLAINIFFSFLKLYEKKIGIYFSKHTTLSTHVYLY